MARYVPPDTAVLRASKNVDWSKPLDERKQFGAGKDQQYNAQEIGNLPVGMLLESRVWQRADDFAKAAINNRRIELVAQEFGPENPAVTTLADNMTKLAQQTPTLDPETLVGIAGGWVNPLADPKTPQTQSDQGQAEADMFNRVSLTDVLSRINEGTYGATEANPFPTLNDSGQSTTGGLAALEASISPGMGEDMSPSGQASGTASVAEDPGIWSRLGRAVDDGVTNFVNLPKAYFNTAANALWAIPQLSNAASETSAGNEAKAAELARRANMTEDQARELFGNYNQRLFGNTEDVDYAGNPLSHWMTDIDPARLVAEAASNPDETIPVGDMSFEQAKEEWMRHLQETEQVSGTGETTYGNLTGRTNLAQQSRTGTMGEGGWFGGVVDEAEKSITGLAGRQSDMRSFADREKARKEADRMRQVSIDAGKDLTIDEYTALLAPRTWTEGRAVTAHMPLSPGGIAEMTVSGLVDTAFTLATDPASYIPMKAPPGAGTAIVNAVSRGRYQSLFDALRNSGKSVTNVGEDFTFAADQATGHRLLHDEAGQAVANTPRLEKTGHEYVADSGHRIVKQTNSAGRTTGWEVQSPVDQAAGVGGQQGQLSFNMYRTLRDAKAAVPTTTRKVDLWREVGDLNPGVALDRAEAAARTGFERATGQNSTRLLTSSHVWDWLNDTRTGGAVVNALASMNNAYDIWVRSGMQLEWATAERLAASRSAPEVRAVLAGKVGTEITSEGALNKFVGARARVVDAKMALANSDKVQSFYRLASMAPKGIPINLADDDEVVRAAHAMGVAFGRKPEDMAPLIDHMMSLDGYGKARFFHEQLIGNFFKQGLIDDGVAPERVERLLNKVRQHRQGAAVKPDKSSAARRAGVAPSWADDQAAQAAAVRASGGVLLDDTVAAGTFARGVNDEVALLAHEIQGSHMILPSARDIRREVSRTAKMMHKGADASDDNLDKLQKTASGFLDSWRNVTLMNGAYVNRQILEELFSMGLQGRRGLLTHPIQYLAAILATHHASEYSSGLRKLTQANKAARNAIGAHERARVKPEDYKGVRMVSVSDMIQALEHVHGTDTQAIGRSGFTVSWDRFSKQVRHGVIKPLEVTVDGQTGRVKLTSGAKRLRAAEEQGLEHVPVRIRQDKLELTEGVDLADITVLTPRGRRQQVLNREVDPSHEDLFGRMNVLGGPTEVVDNARRAAEATIGMRMGLRYIQPYFSGPMARANGEQMMADLERHSRWGDSANTSATARLATRLNGSAAMDEHPQKTLRSGAQANGLVVDPNTGVIDWDHADTREYVKNVADTLADISAVREVREFLRGEATIDDLVTDILNDPKRFEDVLTVMSSGVRESVAKASQHGKLPDDMTEEAMADYYLNEMNGAPANAVRDYLTDTLNNVKRYMGNNSAPRIRKVIEEGQVGQKPLGSGNKKLRALIKDELENNPDFRDNLPVQMQPLESPTDHSRWGHITNAFFKGAGNMRDMITLNPMMRQVYTDELLRLAPFMDPAEHAKLLTNLRAGGDVAFARKFAKTRPSQDGWVDVDAAELLADRTARKTAEDEFYQAFNRQNWAVAMRWASPFAQAAANTTRRWGRAMIKDPVSVYRTTRNVQAVKDGVGEYLSHDRDTAGLQDMAGIQGYLDKNEYGDDMFIYPMVGALAGIFGNLLSRGLDPENKDSFAALATDKSVDLFQSGIFGTGPVVTFMISATPLRNLMTRGDVIGDVTRFMQPYGVDMNSSGNMVQKAAEAFLPAKWVGAVMQDDAKINQMSASIMMARIASGEYGPADQWTQAQSDQIRAEVNADARMLLFNESLAKLTAPLFGGFSFSPLIRMPDDMPSMEGIPSGADGPRYLLEHMMNAEYKRYMEGANSYEERQGRQATFLKDWGGFAQFGPMGTTQSTSGITYTNPDATDFAKVEPGLYKTYRESIGYLFPGGDWSQEWDEFDQTQRAVDKANGVIRERNLQEQWNFMRQKAMLFQMEQEANEATLAGADDATIRAIKQRYEGLGLVQNSTQWTEQHMNRLQEIVNDPQIAEAIPASKNVKHYLQLRAQVKEKLSGAGLVELSGQEAQSMPEVRWLYATGARAAAENKSFSNFWYSLAINEFESN